MGNRATTTPSLTPIFDEIAAAMEIDWNKETAASAVAATADPDGHPNDEDVQLAS